MKGFNSGRHARSRNSVMPLRSAFQSSAVASRPWSMRRAASGSDEASVMALRAQEHDASAAAHHRREIGTGAAFPVLLLTEIRQHVVVGPVAQTMRRPSRIIAAIAAHIGHGVDGRGAANGLAARTFDAPARHRSPVLNAVGQHPAPGQRQLDEQGRNHSGRRGQRHGRSEISQADRIMERISPLSTACRIKTTSTSRCARRRRF
jgi:hypothetical protein